MTKRRSVMVLAVVAMVMGVMGPAGAGGVTAEKLDSTPAWSCQIAGPNGWMHCFNQKNGNGKVIQVRIFGDPGGGYAEGGPFLGTEILIHEDVYNGQPCSTDGGGEYAYLGSGPPFIPYYACHHFAT